MHLIAAIWAFPDRKNREGKKNNKRMLSFILRANFQKPSINENIYQEKKKNTYIYIYIRIRKNILNP